MLNSAKLETVWRTKCSGQFYHTSAFGKSFCKSRGMGADLHSVFLDCRKLTRSKLVQRFNCVDSNEETTKQCMADQLLTRRNNFLSYISFQLFNYQLDFSCFLLASISEQLCNFFEFRSFETLDATLPPWLICRLTDIASWQLKSIVYLIFWDSLVYRTFK